MKVSVLGCGRWGSFIAWYLNKMGHQVCVWGRESSANLEKFQEKIQQGQEGFSGMEATHDLAHALAFGELLAISISAQQLRNLLSRSEFSHMEKPVVLCMKGLEEHTGKRLSEIAADYLPLEQIAVWLGPGHMQDFLAGIPNCMVIDSYNPQLKQEVVQVLKGGLIRFYYGDDMIGNEVGAAAKNVIGIAAGMMDGLHCGSLKGALMSRGAREISRLIGAMGGNELSAYGLAHLGDYEATVFSRYSRNRMFGEKFVRGEQMDGLAEGVSTAAALMVLKEKYQVDLPICTAVHTAIQGCIPPEELLNRLFLRSLKKEF